MNALLLGVGEFNLKKRGDVFSLDTSQTLRLGSLAADLAVPCTHWGSLTVQMTPSLGDSSQPPRGQPPGHPRKGWHPASKGQLQPTARPTEQQAEQGVGFGAQGAPTPMSPPPGLKGVQRDHGVPQGRTRLSSPGCTGPAQDPAPPASGSRDRHPRAPGTPPPDPRLPGPPRPPHP